MHRLVRKKSLFLVAYIFESTIPRNRTEGIPKHSTTRELNLGVGAGVCVQGFFAAGFEPSYSSDPTMEICHPLLPGNISHSGWQAELFAGGGLALQWNAELPGAASHLGCHSQYQVAIVHFRKMEKRFRLTCLFVCLPATATK